MRVPAPPATTVQQTWKGPQAAQRLGILFGREGVPSGPAQGGPCGVVSRPVPGGGAVGYCVPFGWSGLFRCLGAQRPGGPACPAGSPFLPRNGEKEGRGQAPWTPFFRARSLALARFGGCGALFWSIGYYGAHLRALIWDAFSGRAAQPRGFPLGGSCHRR